MSEERTIRIETEIDATPEEVWRAIAEADGITRWFAPEARVTPGKDGKIFLSWGPGMEGEAPIRVWEPGQRLVWVEGEGTPRQKTVEFVIEAQGGKTLLRLVNSGFGPGASFDDEVDTVTGAWRLFFALLRYGSEQFPSAPAVNVWFCRAIKQPVTEVWPRLLGSGGIAIDNTAEGARYHASLNGIPLSGTVLRHPKPGYLALSAETVSNSAVGFFVEKSGATTLFTIEWILYGEGLARESEVRAALGGFWPS
ncbi:MAG: SRPBCC domain-containing protein [Bryobacteraceae bacterium]|nr:SRPBCC domain-containing protein [Bryobacteraceae bacterium]